MIRLYFAVFAVCNTFVRINGNKSFDIHANANNVYGRVPSPKSNGTSVVYLGETQSAKACEDACADVLGETCFSFVYHEASFEDDSYRKGCYGVTDVTIWSPHMQENVTSGQANPRDIRSACEGPEDCSYNGEVRCSHVDLSNGLDLTSDLSNTVHEWNVSM